MACNGMVIVFSGFRSEELENQIKEAGGKIAANFSKATTHLVVDPKGKSSKKLEDVKAWEQVETVELQDFLEERGFELAPKKPRGRKPKSTEPSDAEDEKEDELSKKRGRKPAAAKAKEDAVSVPKKTPKVALLQQIQKMMDELQKLKMMVEQQESDVANL